MRLESAGPRTWLLAGAAGWALLALLLALFGMGGQIAPLPEDTTLLRPLPAVPRPAPERLGPLGQYGEIASRPLFADDRRPHPFSLQPNAGDEKAKAFDYVLTSVMITPSFRMAILQAPDNRTPPLRIKLGETHESLPNWQLRSLDARSAVFLGPEGERRLELRVFNGTGGEAPTAMTAPRRAPGATAPAVSLPETAPEIQPAAPMPSVVEEAAPVTPPVAPPGTRPQEAAPSPPPMTEQAQMEAIRRRIEQRRAQLRREAQLEQQRQRQNTPAR